MSGSFEDRLTGWLRQFAAGAGGEAIGDDAAFLPAGGPWAWTTDTQIEGVHFQPGLSPQLLARRLLAVNLSDLAAVGAIPRYALLALAAPRGFDHRAFFRAFVAACKAHDLHLVGGDLATSPTWTAALTLVGEPAAKRWVERRGARPGDRLWVGGTLGESALGCHLLALGARPKGRAIELPASLLSRSPPSPRLLKAARRAVRRHLAPRPQLSLGSWLAKRTRSAAIDLSDGLSLDLHRLCRASQVGAVLDHRTLPTAADFKPLCQRLGLNSLDLMLAGGEDYVLLFTLPPRVRPPREFFPAARSIGVLSEQRPLRLAIDGKLHPIEERGWDHLGYEDRPATQRKSPPREKRVGSDPSIVSKATPAAS